MPHIDPTVRFWIGVAVTMATGFRPLPLGAGSSAPAAAVDGVKGFDVKPEIAAIAVEAAGANAKVTVAPR